MGKLYEEETMKCIICQSTDINPKVVEEEIRHDTDIVLVPIEVLVCENCGERYYSQSTMHRLEEFKSQVRDHAMPLENVGKVMRAKVA